MKRLNERLKSPMGLVCFLLLILFKAGFLEAASPDPVTPSVKLWQKTLDELEAQIRKSDLGDSDLLDLRARALTIRGDLDPVQTAAFSNATKVQTDLDALGPAPTGEELKEPQSLRERRKHLETELTQAQADGKEIQLIRSRLDRLLDDIKARRREIFAQAILTQTISPLDPDLGSKAAPEWGSLLLGLKDAAMGTFATPKKAPFWILCGGFVVLVGLTSLLRRALKGSLRGAAADELKALALILGEAAAGSLLPLGVIALSLAVALYQVSNAMIDSALINLAWTFFDIFLLQAFFRALLRLPPPLGPLLWVRPESARHASLLILSFAFLFQLFAATETLIRLEDASLEATILAQSVLSLAAALLLFPSLPLVKETGVLQGVLRGLLILLMIMIVLAIFSGYVALGCLLATRGVMTLGLWVGVRMLFDLAQALRLALERGTGKSGVAFLQRFEIQPEDLEMVAFWLELFLKTVFLGLALLLLLLLWSLDRKDLLIFLTDAFHEIRIGKLTFSPSGILEGLLVFVVLMAFTRFIQGVLERKIFPKTRLDFGLRHSIRSGLGYLGFALAAMLSISVMGFDLSNLAIIAGALSVGIGFGLQNIVNNFISGLILLVERPIKAGDWVVVGEHQGIVRKISVRATEIITFDRTTVFIPNSSLVSGSVQNKTHPDRVGRIILPLVVDSGQDPKTIETLVLEIAGNLPEIRKTPAPTLSITGFGDASVKFDLIVFVHEVENVRDVTSTLYRHLLKAFRSQGIREAPLPAAISVNLSGESTSGCLNDFSMG